MRFQLTVSPLEYECQRKRSDSLRDAIARRTEINQEVERCAKNRKKVDRDGEISQKESSRKFRSIVSQVCS